MKNSIRTQYSIPIWTPLDQAGHKSQEESDTGESGEGENEEDENKATKEELYLLLISFFAILGLTHCAMA